MVGWFVGWLEFNGEIDYNKISQQYCPLTFAPALMKTNCHFYTATDAVTDLENVEREGYILQDAMQLLPS